MKTWFNIQAKANDTAEISIFDEIGFWGVTAQQFAKDLKSPWQQFKTNQSAYPLARW